MFFRWEVDGLRLEKHLKKRADAEGYILLESLVSLSILTISLIVILPLTIELLAFRKDEKQQVEMNRVLYDSSIVWDGSVQKAEWTSAGWDYTIHFDNQSIHVLEESGSEKKIEIVSFKFQK